MGSVFARANTAADPMELFAMANPVMPERPAPKDPRAKHRPIPREENMQLECCKIMRQDYPDVLFSSDAAGFMKLTTEQGQRMKRLNSSRGRPDMSIDYPNEVTMPDGTRKFFYGLRLELKPEGTTVWKKDGTLRKQKVSKKYINKRTGKPFIVEYDHLEEQWAMIQEYRRLGFYADFVIGADEFRRLIDWYMGRKTALELDTIF